VTQEFVYQLTLSEVETFCVRTMSHTSRNPGAHIVIYEVTLQHIVVAGSR